MRRLVYRWIFPMLGYACGIASAGVERVEYDGAVYHLYRLDKTRFAELELVWPGKNGKPLGDFTALQKQMADEGRKIVFAMNAGIYERGPKPLGLTISEGKELVPLNLQNGEGNFYLKPNGVFYLDDANGAGVMEVGEFFRSGLKPRLATQSGPLLLRKGIFHPAFKAGSPNKRLRNGVGVRSRDGQIIFAISDRDDRERGRVTLHQFASFFLHLECLDALFLDGDISDMVVEPGDNWKPVPNTFAAMFLIGRR
ncbi:MAG: phosphodiester glycosidase family protein [Verrucomicrobiaceae bacterium]